MLVEEIEYYSFDQYQGETKHNFEYFTQYFSLKFNFYTFWMYQDSKDI